jgi:hypothetical protein
MEFILKLHVVIISGSGRRVLYKSQTLPIRKIDFADLQKGEPNQLAGNPAMHGEWLYRQRHKPSLL